MSRQTAIDKTRIGGSKVRSGCRTCKARRVKCDETKPECRRCIKAERICEGYAPSPRPVAVTIGDKFVHYVAPTATELSKYAGKLVYSQDTAGRVPAPSRSPSPHLHLDESSLRSLDFYMNATAYYLGEPFGIDIFYKSLAQLMQSNKAVQHSVIALAAFHENFVAKDGSVYNEQRRWLALDHYNKSISEVVQSNRAASGHATLTTLVTCLLYSGIESVRGHIKSAMKHIAAGIRVLAEQESDLLSLEDRGQGVSVGFIDTLRCLFIMLGTQAMGIEDMSFDPVALRYIQQKDPGIEGSRYNFSTTQQALVELSSLTNDVIRLLSWTEACRNDSDYPNDALQEAAARLEDSFSQWTKRYCEILEKIGSQPSREINDFEYPAALILRINQLLLGICLKVKFSENQSCFDAYYETYEEVVQLAEEFLLVDNRLRTRISRPISSSSGRSTSIPAFTLTLGIIPAVFFTCIRCRHRDVRQKALNILRSCNRREAMWDAAITGEVAASFIECEEANASRSQETRGKLDGQDSDRSTTSHGPEAIPEKYRVRAIDIDFVGADDKAQISFFDQANNRRHDRCIVWEADNDGGRVRHTGVYQDPTKI